MELHEALKKHPAIQLDEMLLQTSWQLTHIRTVPFCIRVVRETLKRASNEAIDAVLFSSMVTAATAPLLRGTLSARGIPMAAIAHGRDVTLPVAVYQRWAIPRIFRSLDAVLPVSRATGRACHLRGLPESKSTTVPNGVDTDRFEVPISHEEARAELFRNVNIDLPPNALLLCSVGRQVPRKGFAWFVDTVMPQLPDHVHYWIAGDGPEAQAIEESARRNGLTRRVRRLGQIPERKLKLLYRGSDLFIMPNLPSEGDMEGFGVVMLEAGLCGLPTLAARLEGIRDVVDEDENGHLISFGDEQEYVRYIHHYDRDRAALRRLSDRAAAYTRTTYSWDAVADEYVGALRELIEPEQEAVLV